MTAINKNTVLVLMALFVTADLYGQANDDDDTLLGVDEDSYIYLPYEDEEDLVKLPASEGTNSVVMLSSRSQDCSEKLITAQYYDGFGRMKEEVCAGITPARNDLVMLHEYDALGRKTRTWLPAVTTPGVPGEYVPYSQCASGAAGAWADGKPYTEDTYDNVPDGMIRSTAGPGSAWHDNGKTVRYDMLANVVGNDTLNCVLYKTDGNGISSLSLSVAGDYPSGTLSVVRTENEDGVTALEFQDRQGRTVLKRMVEHKGTVKVTYDTYYIYDSRGNLVVIVPPALAAEYRYGDVPYDYIYEYAYIYEYDGRNRRCSAKMPGADAVLTEYDGADRPLFVQTGEQRKRNESTFHIYDKFGRECITGTCSYNIPAPGQSLYFNEVPYCAYTGGGWMGYDVYGLALTGVRIMTVNYYDTYGFADGHSELAYTKEDGYGRKFNKAQGLLTGRATACLCPGKDDSGYIYEAVYYDWRQRVVHRKATNYLEGTDAHFYAYNFSGQETAHRHVHTGRVQLKPATTVQETTTTYDHAGRLLRRTHSVNGSEPVTIASCEYDEFGRLLSDSRNGNAALTTGYKYNIRSWMTGISGSLLDMSMCYETGEYGGRPCFSGNMSSLQWQAGDGKERSYSFSYDGLSRLTGAAYLDVSSGQSGQYDTEYSYDKQGNILSLRRSGLRDGGVCGIIDDLTYEYDGNRLRKVSDAVGGPYYKGAMHFNDGAYADTEYTYNLDGSLVSDKNKKIKEVRYNIAGLPESILFDNKKNIEFTYTATGEKLRADYVLDILSIEDPKISVLGLDAELPGEISGDDLKPLRPSLKDSIGMTDEYITLMYGLHRIDYCGNVIYENLRLDRLLFDGGYVTFTNKKPVYHFCLSDHQGNVRVVADANGNVEQVNHYYPFGALFGESTGKDVHRYKYNGKELDRLLALDWYDYGARWYDPVLARWHVIDPMAEVYSGVTPFGYCQNNPINKIDPDGTDDYYTNSGLFLYSDNKVTDFIIIRNEALYKQKQMTNAVWINPYTPLEETVLSSEAYSNIFTDVLSKMNGVNVANLHNGKVSVTVWQDDGNMRSTTDQYNDAGLTGDVLAGIGPYKGKQRLTAYVDIFGTTEQKIYSSRSNIQNLLGVHEYIEHFRNDMGNDNNSHLKIYKSMQQHPSWRNTTPSYKKYMINIYNSLKRKTK